MLITSNWIMVHASCKERIRIRIIIIKIKIIIRNGAKTISPPNFAWETWGYYRILWET
jgi:hypothetical protein